MHITCWNSLTLKIRKVTDETVTDETVLHLFHFSSLEAKTTDWFLKNVISLCEYPRNCRKHTVSIEFCTENGSARYKVLLRYAVH